MLDETIKSTVELASEKVFNEKFSKLKMDLEEQKNRMQKQETRSWEIVTVVVMAFLLAVIEITIFHTR